MRYGHSPRAPSPARRATTGWRWKNEKNVVPTFLKNVAPFCKILHHFAKY
jgi:hypothetical protein